MKYSLKLTFPLLCVVLIIFACKKKEIPPVEKKIEPPKETKLELLTKHKWVLYERKVNPGDSSVYEDYASCFKDNSYEYLTSSIFVKDEGSTKCFASDPQIDSTANWELKQDSLFVNYPLGNGQFYKESYFIIEITKTNMILSSFQMVNKEKITYTSFYKPL